jgi:hypothetical protein
MGSAIRLLAAAVLYACLATVLGQGAVAAYLWSTGALDGHRARQIAAILAGLELVPAAPPKGNQGTNEQEPQVSFDEVLQRRALISLDLDLREQAVTKGLSDLRALTTTLAEETRRFDQRREAFQASLKELEEGAKDTAITEVRRTLEAMRPRQAKTQLIRMLEDEQMLAVVTMIKAMSLDKRKKLLAEFKQTDEADHLADILRKILEGVPETSLIEQSQKDLTAAQP